MRVRKLVQDPNVTAAQVEKLINMDMALSARLLIRRRLALRRLTSSERSNGLVT